MFVALVILPALVALASFLLYKHTGKKEVLKFDLVQFVYAFVLAPLAFIWMKGFLMLVVQSEIDPALSPAELFIIDTTFSVLFLFFYAFVVIHSLTKSFEIKRYSDPLYDILAHSESFHLWISHTFMYTITLVVFSLFSLTNMILPLDVELSRTWFLGLIGVGVLSGLIGFAAIWLSNFSNKFMKLMKLVFAILFTAHIFMYYFLHPGFDASFLVYWIVFALLGAMVFASFFVEKSARSQRFINRFHHKHKDGWSINNFLTFFDH